MRHGDAVNSACFSADGCFIVTASWDGTARLWDAQTHLPLEVNAVIKHSSRVTDVAVHPDGHHVVTCCVDGSVRLWDLAASAIMPRLLNGVLSPDGRRCATATNQTVLIRPTANSSGSSAEVIIPCAASEVEFSEDGKWLLSLSVTTGETNPPLRSLRVWDDDRPIHDLVLLAQFLASYQDPASGEANTSDSAAMRATWQVLRTRYPDDSVVLRDELIAWHRLNADRCEESEQWSGLCFHLNHLAALAPADETITARRARALKRNSPDIPETATRPPTSLN